MGLQEEPVRSSRGGGGQQGRDLIPRSSAASVGAVARLLDRVPAGQTNTVAEAFVQAVYRSLQDK